MLTRRREDERGAVAILFAVLALILFITAALVIDLGQARDIRRQSQNSSDAAALAAANALYPGNGVCTTANDDTTTISPCFADAVAAAKSYATANFQVSPAAWSACTDPGKFWVPTGSTPCISFTDATLATTKPAQPLKVRVITPVRSVGTGFGVLAGVSTIPVSSIARATLKPGENHSCGLCILGSGVSDVGNGDVTVTGGSVFDNGSVSTQPNGHLTVQPAGQTITMIGACSGNCSPTALPATQPIPDPYPQTTLALPPAGISSLTVKSNPCTDGPGKYGTLTVQNSSCPLQPGLYVITGTWTDGNNTDLSGTGVTIYATCGTPAVPTVCTTGQTGGTLNLKNGDATFSAPASPTPPPTGGAVSPFAVIYDRLNAANLTLQGNGNTNITGTIYAPNAQLTFPGNSYFGVTNGPVVVGSLYGNGNQGGLNLSSVNGASYPSPPGSPSLDQ